MEATVEREHVEEESELKRKRSTSQEESESKKMKSDDTADAPEMSGALPPESTTTIASTKEDPAKPAPSPSAKETTTRQTTTEPSNTPVPPSTSTSSTSHPPAARIRMTVTSGFYVRSLCHDLGIAVNSLAIMSALVRTRQGDFELGKNVFEYDDLAKGEEVWGSKVEGLIDAWNDKRE